jgi:hypothetical protein
MHVLPRNNGPSFEIARKRSVAGEMESAHHEAAPVSSNNFIAERALGYASE